MSGRALVSSIVCLGLAGCVTDKISMSSEVGGSGGSSVVSARANKSGASGIGGGDPRTRLGETREGAVL
ncbi:MAG: hypothetical protein RID59_07520, partial [Hoeflea sp.]